MPCCRSWSDFDVINFIYYVIIFHILDDHKDFLKFFKILEKFWNICENLSTRYAIFSFF